jgi:indole-3-glycerol phosphate synthase
VRIQEIEPAAGRTFLLIAEAKPVSPFAWRSDRTWDELFALAARVGDVVSVHTDARWGGSIDLIAKARTLTAKPILAKGIHASDDEIRAALAAGADFALVVGRLPAADLLPRCLVEPNSVAELGRLPAGTAAVWNSRDLSTGGPKAETFAEARAAWGGWLCQASNLKTPADVAPGADAALVGEALPSFILDSAFI